MRLATYHRRSLWHYRRTNLAVVLGAAVATSALTGALIVGDSMRASLRDAALGRLGKVQHALVAQRFFRAALAAEIAGVDETHPGSTSTAPVILLTAGVTHADSRRRSNGINLLGVDRRFWNLDTVDRGTPAETSSDRTVVLNQPLADELGAEIGDDVLIRTAKPSAISTETLLGRRDDTTSTIRLTVASIIPARGLGAFTLGARQAAPKNAFVPLATLQRSLKRPDGVNAILVGGSNADNASSPDLSTRLQDRLAQSTTLADLGLSLRVDETRGYIALESESILIEPPVEEAAIAAARDVEAHSTLIFTHLANKLTRVNPSTNTSTHSGKAVSLSSPLTKGGLQGGLPRPARTSPDPSLVRRGEKKSNDLCRKAASLRRIAASWSYAPTWPLRRIPTRYRQRCLRDQSTEPRVCSYPARTFRRFRFRQGGFGV